MNRIVIAFAFLLLACAPSFAQSDYYIRKAEEYTREAEYYQRKANEYRRDAQYYMDKAAMYLRWASDALSHR